MKIYFNKIFQKSPNLVTLLPRVSRRSKPGCGPRQIQPLTGSKNKTSIAVPNYYLPTYLETQYCYIERAVMIDVQSGGLVILFAGHTDAEQCDQKVAQ